jgi:uncharacterized protein
VAPRAIEAANLKVKLFPSPIEPSWVIEGNPRARSCTLSRSTDEGGWTAVWECTEGKFNWYYGLDETILILEGSIILENDSLPRTRYGVGDVILFRKGAHARWHVDNYVKKLAFGHNVTPAPIAFGVRTLRSYKSKLSSLAQRRYTPLPHGDAL